MKIRVEDSMVLIIDFQDRLMPSIEENQEIISRTSILLQGLSLLQVPMMVTRQYPKGLGDTVIALKEVTEAVPVHDKITFSCYGDEKIRQAIKENNKKNIILCGVEAHICVLQTLIDLRADGYQTIFVEDCIGSRKSNDKRVAVMRAVNEGAVVTTSESILFELLQEAGTNTFKRISALIK